MTSTSTTLPQWDMTMVYPGLSSPEFEGGFRAMTEDVERLARLWDERGVDASPSSTIDEKTVGAFDEVVAAYNAVLKSSSTLYVYVYSFVATDSRDDLAQARQSELQQQMVKLSQLGARFVAWIGSLDVEALITRSSMAAAHAYMLRKAAAQAAHLMSPAEEALADELALTGPTAWSKLYYSFTSQLAVPVDIEGETQSLPMSAIRNLAHDADRAARARAYDAEIAAWTGAALPIAAALNAIKGQINTLTAKRGWASPLDAALFGNNIDRATLDAMMEATHDSFPDFRRYLAIKARALGVEKMAWYDLFAPVGSLDESWDWEDAERFIVTQFGGFGPKMRALAERAFHERWIDAGPRPGKRDGAFCIHLRDGESRVLANYSPTFDAVSTLAHELGHAYHNLNLAARTPLQRSTPMTLAETASTFCETIVTQAGMRQATPQGRLALLDASLQGACQIVVDITSRFLFESRLFEMRQKRDLSIDDLNALMLDAQRETYGDGLDGRVLHPYMWAVKSHYYSSSFYNYPYMFGQLFGLGLYAQYEADPASFVARYDDLLSSTGLDDAATLAARFDIDVRAPAFWTKSLDVIRRDIDAFDALVP